MEEWRRGWRTVLGAALAAATGVNLLYFVFSLFIPHLQKETGWTLGQFSQLQAIVGIGSLAAPLAGWAMDRYGCRKVWAAGMVAIALLYMVVGVAPVIPAMFGALVFALCFFFVSSTSFFYTRAVNSWFERQRGLALALSATGISLAAIFLPPVLERIITFEGWRTGFPSASTGGGSSRRAASSRVTCSAASATTPCHTWASWKSPNASCNRLRRARVASPSAFQAAFIT